MRYTLFETLITPQRLTKYNTACINDTRKTMSLYRANIRISQAFLAVLSIFEVVLRNKIDAHYKARFPSTAPGIEWLLGSTLPGGFLTPLNCQNSANKITSTYNKLGANYTHDKLVAELSFGFWKFLFAGHQFFAGGNTLLAIMPQLPPHFSQTNVYQTLDRINAIRNRVAHHEPICFSPTHAISTIYARTRFQEILDVVTWMGINSSHLFYGVDSVLKEAGYIDGI